MSRLIQSAVALCALATLQPIAAPAQEMKPGLWQYTVNMNMPGMPAGAQTQTFRQCVTPQEVKDRSAYMRADPGDRCSMSDFKQQGSQFSYNVSCKGEMNMTGRVTGNATPESMTMNMDMTMSGGKGGKGGMSMKQTMTAKRVGDCKK